MPSFEEIKTRFDEAGQSHVLKHYDSLSEDEKTSFLEQLDGITSLKKLKGLLKAALEDQSQTGSTNSVGPFTGKVALSFSKEDAKKWRQAGLETIQQGKLAALVLAGGQGTRLGFIGPKGMYNIGLPSNKTLFHIVCERIQKLQELAGPGAKLPFYVMTSPLNHETTVKYFEENNNFGIDVHFFPQGMLPCLKEDGSIILESAGKVAMAPDGNGGIYPSLQSSGTLAQMKSAGVEYLHVFSIDNALVKPADPLFCGYCISELADCGNLVVWKAAPHEKVGVIAQTNGKPCVVEYSDISKEMAERVDPDTGKLVFGAGNICNHFYTLEFIDQKILGADGFDLYHVARKKIPYFDETKGETVKPESNNGIKLESFIFDCFPLSESMAVMDAPRAEGFAPVKNAPGSASDSPDVAREMLSARAKGWMKAAGAELEDGEGVCEIQPLTSYDGEGLEEYSSKMLRCPFSV